jgi:hypothetical protein
MQDEKSKKSARPSRLLSLFCEITDSEIFIDRKRTCFAIFSSFATGGRC